MSDDPVLAALARLETNLSAMDAKLSGLDAKLSGLDAKVSGLDAKVSGLDAKVSGLDAKVSGLDAKVSAMDAKLSALDARVDRLEAGQTSLRVDLMERMDRLQNSLQDIRDDITVNIARANRLDDRLVTARQDTSGLASEVATVYRRLRQLEARVREITGDP